MSTLLLEDVPLVSSDTLQNFAEGELIGHHYGDLTRSRVKCIKVSATEWNAGAHPWREITACFVGGKRTSNYEPFIREDSDGVTRQFIRFTAPPSSDAFTVEVSGYGKVSPVSGKLLENPDEIIQDIAAVAGKELSFPAFRQACNRRSLRIAGSVYRQQSVRATIQEILDSCGALWAGNDAFFMADPVPYATEIAFPSSLTHLIEAGDVAGQLDLFYAWNQANENHGAHILLEAVGCQYDNIGNYSAKWLRHPRDAQRLAEEILGKRAGRFCKVNATVPGRFSTGDAVSIANDTFTGPFRIMTARASNVETEITGELVFSLYSNLRIVRFTQEVPPSRRERVDVLILEGDIIEVTIFDLQNRSMPNVFVTLDSRITYKTDARGLVTFKTNKGNHTLSLAGPDIESNEPFPFYVP